MNWDRGLIRITFVLSIIGAIVVAMIFFCDSIDVFGHNEIILETTLRNEFSEVIDGLSLIEEWKQANTSDEQDSLWIKWTGERLPTEPLWLDENASKLNDPNDPRLFGQEDLILVRLSPTTEETPRLKKQGWQTIKGEPLPLTPKGIWYIQNQRKIEDLKSTVRQNRIEIPIATAAGAFIGFIVVWIIYVVMIEILWPVYKWITLGFREDK